MPLDNAQDSPPVEAWVGLGRHGRRRNAKVLGRKGFGARPDLGADALAFVEPRYGNFDPDVLSRSHHTVAPTLDTAASCAVAPLEG